MVETTSPGTSTLAVYVLSTVRSISFCNIAIPAFAIISNAFAVASVVALSLCRVYYDS